MPLDGYLELCTSGVISGWAWNSDHPRERVGVEILVDGTPLARVTAQQYRKDLTDCGIGDGNYGFWYTPLSPIDPKVQRISVVVVGTDFYLRRIPGPIPPEGLRERVAGTTDEQWFHASGAMTVDEWTRALNCINRGIGEFEIIADFGCGCGRALRHLEMRLTPEQRLIGLDVDREAIQWLVANYPQISTIALNDTPPIPLEDGGIDLIVSHSVFTHLPEEIENLWISELRRILKHNGILITSIHGIKVIEEYKANLTAQNQIDERVRFEQIIENHGFYHLLGKSTAEAVLPEYYGASFHTIKYIITHWAELFEIRAWLPVFALNYQDVLVLQKRNIL